MTKTFTLLAFCLFSLFAKAQTAPPAAPTDQPYGKIDIADLQMTSCDYEKDANAEVLIDKADLYFDQTLNVVVDHHKRIKIFNDKGKDYANIKLEYIGADNYEFITGLQAETINLVDGKPVITKLDKKQLFTQKIDKYRSALVFTMPDVKAGSIIEYKYSWNTTELENVPTWYFQDEIPVRYNELDTSIPEWFYFSTKTTTLMPYSKRSTSTGNGTLMVDNANVPYNTENEQRVMFNVPSLPDEPYMSSRRDNLQSLTFVLTSFKPPYGFQRSFSNSWSKVGGILIDDEDFGGQLKRKLTNEDALINKAKAFKTDDEKIAFLFNEVKNDMKWNGEDHWYTNDGTCKAWDNKSGNSTEINLILYHLLKKSGVDALPMVVSTREHGKVNPVYSFLYQFNKAIVYIPVDSTKSYFLDATGKYNSYTETPDNLLNSSGLYINAEKKTYDLVFLQKTTPVIQSVFINAEIKPEGKMAGNVQISSPSYNRINSVSRYKTDGEAKYIDYLRDNDNNLKISNLKFENMDVDTLPLMQSADFNLDLSGSDENYIYITPNLFTSLGKNRFLSQTRNTNIEFGYRDNLSVNGIYKLPAGYKVDALPKSVSMTMPDKSITFRRIVAQQDGQIVVRYSIDHKQSMYFKENYPDFYEFYKKMFELMNEQIVLKKG